MIPAAPLSAEFGFGISRDIHFPAELLLDSPQCGQEICHAHLANYQQIDVALRLLLTTCNRSVNSRPLDAIGEVTKFGFEQRYDSGRFGEQGAEFRENRRGGLGAIVGAPTFLPAPQNAAFGESIELPLKAGRRSPEVHRQF